MLWFETYSLFKTLAKSLLKTLKNKEPVFKNQNAETIEDFQNEYDENSKYDNSVRYLIKSLNIDSNVSQNQQNTSFSKNIQSKNRRNHCAIS